MDVFREAFVPSIQAAPYHKKWVAANSGEAQKWATYRDAVLAATLVAGPAPVPPALSTRYGKALVAAAMMGDLLTLGAGLPPVAPAATTRRGQVSWAEVQVVGAPAVTPNSLLTREVTLPTDSHSYWLAHDSPNTQIMAPGSWRDAHRIIRWAASPSRSDPGLYSGRLTYAVHGFRMPQNGGFSGRIYDWHCSPSDDPWGWTPPLYPGGPGTAVAPIAIDYWGTQTFGPNSIDGLVLVSQPENQVSATYHFQIMSRIQLENLRGTWIWIWLEIRWGRDDTPGFPGGLRCWIDDESSPRVDVQNINTHWHEQHHVTFWEGEYIPSLATSTKVIEIAATRFGTTPQKAYEDVPVLFVAEAAGLGGDLGGSSVAIAPRLSTEASIPPSLQW